MAGSSSSSSSGASAGAAEPEKDFDIPGALERLELPGGWVKCEDFEVWLRAEIERVSKKGLVPPPPPPRPPPRRLSSKQRRRLKLKQEKMARGEWPWMDCPHTDAEHAELETTMGPILEQWRQRGRDRLGDEHTLVPSLEEMMPPPEYLEGLSPLERERLKALDIFKRIHDSERSLKDICGHLGEEGQCKFLANEDLHLLVMCKAMSIMYCADDDGCLDWSDMSYKGGRYIDMDYC